MPETPIQPEQFPKSSPEVAQSPEPESAAAPAPAAPEEKHTAVPQATPQIPADAAEEFTPEEEKELEEIEDILEEDLSDVYRELDPATQKTFKESGEETTKKVFELVHQTKVKTKRIIKTIASWLRIIPGVNSYYIEQEAKLKTDKIVDLHENEHPDTH